jgi:hypothetical protein
MFKKPKSTLRTQLSELQQAQLADWLIGGMKYYDAVPVIEKEFGLKLGGGWKKQLSHFWDAVCVPRVLDHRDQAVSTAEEIATDATRRPDRFHAATIDRLRELSFRLSLNPNCNPKDVKALYSLVLKSGDQDLAREQLQLDREKFQFDAVEAAMSHVDFIKATKANPKLSQAEKINAIRQRLFGVLPETPAS